MANTDKINMHEKECKEIHIQTVWLGRQFSQEKGSP